MSLLVNVEIESTDTVVKQYTQALIDCGATGCFIDIEWEKLNNIPIHPLCKPIPAYNVDSTTNNASMIRDIANIILYYKNHSECTQLAITHLGKQSDLGVQLAAKSQPRDQLADKRCQNVLQCSTCRVEDMCDAKIQKSTTSQINACWSGAFPTMVGEDEDKSSHVNTDETDEEAQDTCPAFDIVKSTTSLLRRMTVFSR
jgi:hypothetical protein